MELTDFERFVANICQWKTVYISCAYYTLFRPLHKKLSPQPSRNRAPYIRLPGRPALSLADTTSQHATRHDHVSELRTTDTVPLIHTIINLFIIKTLSSCSTTLCAMRSTVQDSST